MPRAAVQLTVAVLIGWLLSSAVSQAAPALLSYRLFWQPNRSVVLQAANGTMLKPLKLGGHLTVRHGSELLTLSLRSSPSFSMAAATRALLTAINTDRAAHHVGPLLLNAQQSSCSLQHSVRMAAQGSISHDQFPGDVCVPHTRMGENVGVDSAGPVQGVLTLERMMMGEGPCPHAGCPGAEAERHGHYLNLLNPAYHQLGIGIDAAHGQAWLTEDFID